MNILVTGGAGYIGSHTCLELLKSGNQVVVLDNLSNSNLIGLRRVEELTGKKVKFFEADLLGLNAVKKVFDSCPDIESVIHFAGLKAVGESVEQPQRYYQHGFQQRKAGCAQYNCRLLPGRQEQLLSP